jgi:hypothetical protein
LGRLIRQFIVVEPLPMVSLADLNCRGLVGPALLISGLCSVAATLTRLHESRFGFGAIGPLNIVINRRTFELRPPPLWPDSSGSFAPPPLVHRPTYRVLTDDRFYHFACDFLRGDCLAFAKLLVDFAVYHGRSTLGDFSEKAEFEKYSGGSLISEITEPQTDLFLSDDMVLRVRRFLTNRIKLIEGPDCRRAVRRGTKKANGIRLLFGGIPKGLRGRRLSVLCSVGPSQFSVQKNCEELENCDIALGVSRSAYRRLAADGMVITLDLNELACRRTFTLIRRLQNETQEMEFRVNDAIGSMSITVEFYSRFDF